MKVFVTGASGFIGKETTKLLISKGHSVLGLARSETSAAIIKDLNAEVLMGDLDNIEALKTGAKECDAIIHLGFVHDFSSQEAIGKAAATDKAAVDAMTDVITGTKKPIVVISGVMGFPGHLSEDTPSSDSFLPRMQNAASFIKSWEENQVRGSVLRLPLVHGPNDPGFITIIVNTFKSIGKVYKIGKGTNRVPCVHVSDVANLLLLAVEKTETPVNYHGIAELFKDGDFVNFIGEEAKLPIEEVDAETAGASLGILAAILTTDFDIEFSKTQKTLGWNPVGPKLFEDMKDHYF